MGSTLPPFTIKDEPIENLRPLKVRVIGAGYSGIYLGIRIPQRLRNVDLQIYEKNEGVGGAWWENRYPGCACDIPAHSYQYSFDPNPHWTNFYAPSKEIREYLGGIAEKYGVNRFVKLSHKVTSCIWDDAAKKWKIDVENLKTGEVIHDDADILVSARGSLNEKAWPKIPGFETFKGEVMHSAQWNEEYDFKNKRVGVIGGGSSSIQIVPNLQKIEGVKMSCFVRSRTWIASPFGDASMEKLGLERNNTVMSAELRQEFVNNPKKFYEFRKIIEVDGNTIHGASFRDSPEQLGAQAYFRSLMKEKLAKKPEIMEALVPNFSVGCRRLTPGPGYLEALVEDNVDFVTDPIESITPEGIILANGKKVDLDVLVCATGFNVSSPPPFYVEGLHGMSLQQRFQPHPETYLAVGVDGFPNFFMMFGPNSAIGSGSLTMMIESEGDYITKCIRKLQKEDYVTMMPKPERVKDFSEYCVEYFKKTVYLDQCTSWYRSEGGKGNRIIGLWPGSTLHCLEALRAPRWEDFDFESNDENRLRWLGNGWSVTQIGDGGDPAWYLEPSLTNVPLKGKPEEDEEYKRRPFSH